MEITLQQLYDGLPCVIKNKEFYSAKTYVDPFINKMSAITSNFKIEIKTADTLSKNSDSLNNVYTRAWVQAILPEKFCVDNHDEVIGMIYGLDVKTPVVKFYKGMLNRACTNLSVFNPEWLNIQELVPGDPINYRPIKDLLEYTNDFAVVNKRLHDTVLDTSTKEKQHALLGEWVDYSLRNHDNYGYGKVKIASSVPIKAYEQLFIDESSDYFIPKGYDPTMFDVYNSFTQIITNGSDKDLLNNCEKTLLIGKLLGIN